MRHRAGSWAWPNADFQSASLIEVYRRACAGTKREKKTTTAPQNPRPPSLAVAFSNCDPRTISKTRTQTSSPELQAHDGKAVYCVPWRAGARWARTNGGCNNLQRTCGGGGRYCFEQLPTSSVSPGDGGGPDTREYNLRCCKKSVRRTLLQNAYPGASYRIASVGPHTPSSIYYCCHVLFTGDHIK